MKSQKIVLVSLITDDLCDRLEPIIDHCRKGCYSLEICLYDIYRGRYKLGEVVSRLEGTGCKVAIFTSMRTGVALLNNSRADTGLFLFKHAQKNIHNLFLYFLYRLSKLPAKLFTISNIQLIRAYFMSRQRSVPGRPALLVLKTSLMHVAGCFMGYGSYFLFVKPIVFLFSARRAAPPSYKKILVIRTDHIGDVICTLPALKALRGHFPQAHITVLGASWSCQPLKANPELYDELLICDTPWLNRAAGFKWGWTSVSKLCKSVIAIRKSAFDLVIQPRGDDLDVLLAVLSGGKMIVSTINIKRPVAQLLKKKVDLPVVLSPYHTRHISEWPALCIGQVGVEVREPDIRNAYCEQRHFDEFTEQLSPWVAKGYRVCAVIIGAGSSAREWPSAKFAALISLLYEQKVVSLLIGSRSEQQKRAEIVQQLDVPVIDMITRTNFENITAVLAASNFIVTLDTSIMHLASLLNKKIFAIFSSGNLNLAKPVFNTNNRIIKKELGCSGCGDRCFFDHPKCIEAVSVEEVFRVIFPGNDGREVAKVNQ